jgi:CRP-like cAMP-binding protein
MNENRYNFPENQKVNIVIEGMNTCWKDVIHLAKLHSFSKGQVVDQSDDGVYLIKEGYLSYSCYLHSGERRILYFVGRDSLSNEAGCMIHHKDRVSFEFLTDTQAYVFPPKIFMDVDFVRSYPELCINLSQYIIFKRIYLSHFVANLDNHKPITRVSEILFQLYESKSRLIISQLKIGNFLGLHQMTVSRALSQLRDENIIGKISKNKFDIFAPERLDEYAQW